MYKDKLLFKGTSSFTKNKTKTKIPKVLWDVAVSEYKRNASFLKRRERFYSHLVRISFFFRTAMPSFNLKICAYNGCADRPLSREM